MLAEYLECGKIINTHGIDGKVKIESYCDSPEVLAGLKYVYRKSKDGYIKQKVKSASVFKAFVIAKIEGIENIDDATMSQGTILYADRHDIVKDDGDYFISDLIGLSVIDIDTEKVYGKLADVINRGASDIYVINTPNGESLVPAVKEFVKNIELEKGIYIKPIEGMFD